MPNMRHPAPQPPLITIIFITAWRVIAEDDKWWMNIWPVETS